MKRRIGTILIFLLLMAPAASASPASPATPATVASLSTDEATRMVTDLMPKVEELRGLKFKHPVPVRVVQDAVAREHFKARMKKYWPEAQVRAEQTAYTQLGLLPPGVDIESTLFSVLEEQVGGYYDPEADTFYVLGDMPRSFASVLMVHELTHALDDQHYGIDRMIDAAKDDSDKSDAVGAVVEGSGTLVMSRYMFLEITAGRMPADILVDLARTDAGRAEKLMASPQVLQRSLVASYVLGQTFILRGDLAKLALATPTADLDRLFHDPPASTEQILHPEKYWDDSAKDLPRVVTLADLSSTLGEGWKLSGGGVLGELTIAVMTGAGTVDFKSIDAADPSHWTNEAASGWGGDRWQLYANGDRRVTLLATVWDSPSDANQFEAALVTHEAGVSRRRWRQGDAVVLVAGDAGDRADAVAAAALKETRGPN